MATQQGSLATKLAQILGEIDTVPKSGRNEFHHYDYVTENDLVHAVRRRLAAAKIFVFTSIESQHVEIIEDTAKDGSIKKSLLTTVVTKHTFMDGDSGETFSVNSQGQGNDVGDKGGYKAITGAMKYFIYKCFMVPTGDDPEADGRTDKRLSEGSGPKGRTTIKTATTKDSGDRKEQFRNNKWGAVKVHFGRHNGTILAELTSEELEDLIKNFVPKTTEELDLILRAALDVADQEWR